MAIIQPSQMNAIFSEEMLKYMYVNQAKAIMQRLDGNGFDLSQAYQSEGIKIGTRGGVRLTPLEGFIQQMDLRYLSKKPNINTLIISVHNASGLGGPAPISNIIVHVLDSDEFVYCVITSAVTYNAMTQDQKAELIKGACVELNRHGLG